MSAVIKPLNTSSIGDNVLHLDADTAENAEHFVACSTGVIHESAIAIEVRLIDEEIEEERAYQAEIAMRTRESDFYRVLRSILIDQASQEFERGEKLMQIFGEVEGPMTEDQFDECMQRALLCIPK